MSFMDSFICSSNSETHQTIFLQEKTDEIIHTYTVNLGQGTPFSTL